MWTWKSLALVCGLAVVVGYCGSRSSCCRGSKGNSGGDDPPGSSPGDAGSGPRDAGAAPDDARVAWCKARHGFAALAGAGGQEAGDGSGSAGTVTCPDTKCGDNGVWLGSGVQFRTLHLRPERTNEANLSIVGFVGKHGEPLTVDVNRDVLRGATPQSGPDPGKQSDEAYVQDKDLVGAQLLLGHLDRQPPVVQCGPFPCRNGGTCVDIPDDGCNPARGDRDCPGTCVGGVDAATRTEPRAVTIEYRLKITDVNYTDFWAQGPSYRGAATQFPVYSFVATSDDGCEVEMCAPGLSDDHPDDISGKAVMFRGDFYDEGSHGVTTSPATAYDDDVFNIACLGTAISKLHLLRHTSASQIDPANPADPQPDKRTTMLRLLTADYCGNGTSFTQNGLALRFNFDSSIYSLTKLSEYGMDDAESLEALWTPQGALCIGTPRLLRGSDKKWHDRAALIKKINETCAGGPVNSAARAGNKSPLPHVVQDCKDLPDAALATPFKAGNYAISGNPKVLQ
jgi:hypothetical protein